MVKTEIIAGNPDFHVVGFQNGPCKLAKFDGLWGIALNPIDNCLYVSDNENYCVRKINNNNGGMKIFLL